MSLRSALILRWSGSTCSWASFLIFFLSLLLLLWIASSSNARRYSSCYYLSASRIYFLSTSASASVSLITLNKSFSSYLLFFGFRPFFFFGGLAFYPFSMDLHCYTDTASPTFLFGSFYFCASIPSTPLQPLLSTWFCLFFFPSFLGASLRS